MKTTFLIILLPFISILMAYGQNGMEVTGNENLIVIEHDYLQIIKDTTNELTFEEVKGFKGDKWGRVNDLKEPLVKKNTYWLKFSVKNNGSTFGDWVIESRDIGHLDAFIVDANHNVQKAKAGIFMPVPKRQIKGGILSAIKFYLAPNETKVFYLKARNETDFSWLEKSALSITDTEIFIRNTAIDNLLQGVFQGFLWLMLLYNLFLYITTKQKSYLYYILYVFSFSMVLLYGEHYLHNYIFPNQPIVSSYFGVFLYVAFTSYFLLMREFIDAPHKHPRFNKVLKVIIALNAFVTVFILISQFVNPNNFQSLGLEFVMANSLILIFCIVFILLKGSKVAKLFALGTMFLALCITISTGFTMAGYYSDGLMLLFEGGIAGEVFIFSIGLSYKLKLAEYTRQKAQDELIVQLKENEHIKNEANQQLEQKVEERTTELNVEKLKVEKKNRHITDSINYASRIQRALLPSQQAFEESLPNHFILYKPKDIVSGDFYYLKKYNDNLVIAAADCTGHGVPGAFVSMLGIAFLNEILAKYTINSAAHILEELRTLVKSSLQQTQDKSKTKDGMDIAICLINKQTNRLQFSGAYNSLYLIRNKELIEVKATRNPVGVFIKEKDFVNNEVEIQKGDRFYIFSDGYADQFGGKEDRKFLTKNFKKLLQEIVDHPFAEQKNILDTTIENWKGKKDQNDDILVIGFEID